MKTVVGLFDDIARAKTAALDLEEAGIPHNDISLVANNEGGRYAPTDTDTPTTTTTGHAIGHDALVGAEIGGVAGLLLGLTGFAVPGVGWVVGAGWIVTTIVGAGAGAMIGGLVGALTDVGVPAEDAAQYTEGVRRGGVLLAVKAQDDMAHRAAQIIGDDGAVNIEERAAQFAQAGTTPSPAWSAPTAATATPAPAPAATQLANRAAETVLPVTEEQIEVGKREVQRGGVRVYTHVDELPAQEQVTLREEHVEPIQAGEHASRTRTYEVYITEYRNHYQSNYGNLGGSFEQYQPAYRYGYDLSKNPSYRGRDWASIEPDIRRDWEFRQPNTWDRFKNAIRFAWDRATATVGTDSGVASRPL